MQNTRKIDDHVTTGPQPDEEDIQKLRDRGFKSVVNFRTEGEPEQPLSPGAEAEAVKAAGMEYLHVPVSMESLKPETVDRFRERFSQLPKPVFAHCQSGKRAGAMAMMNVAHAKGMTGEQTLRKAKEMGFECDQPELMEFVKTYVDSRSA